MTFENKTNQDIPCGFKYWINLWTGDDSTPIDKAHTKWHAQSMKKKKDWMKFQKNPASNNLFSMVKKKLEDFILQQTVEK